jgi:hypothetical protein
MAPPEHKAPFALKTIERCLRMGAKLAVEFGVPPCTFMEIAREQILREGGKEVAEHLALHEEPPIDPNAEVEGKNVLVEFFDSMGVKPSDDPNQVN